MVFYMFVAVVFFSCSSMNAEASTGGHSADDAVNWVKSQVGKGLDYDGVYGNQCVDLICYYYRYLGQTSPALIVKVVVSKNIYFLFVQVIRYCSVPDHHHFE